MKIRKKGEPSIKIEECERSINNVVSETIDTRKIENSTKFWSEIFAMSSLQNIKIISDLHVCCAMTYGDC